MGLLLRLEALERQALRAAVAAQSVLLPTPALRALVCIEEGDGIGDHWIRNDLRPVNPEAVRS